MDTMWLLQWSAIAVGLWWIIYKLGTWTFDEFEKRGMAFKKPTFFVGNFGPFIFRTKSLAEQSVEVYTKFKGHRAVGFFSFFHPTVVVMDPEVLKLVTVKDFDHFTDHDPIIEEKDDLFFGSFLFSMKGAKWRAMRNILSPAFTSSKMKGMFVYVAKCGEQLGEYLAEKCKGEKDGIHSVEMRDLFSKYTNDVIATSAFGIHCDTLKDPNNEFYERGKEATDFGGIKNIIFLLYAIIPPVMRFFGIRITSLRVEKFFVSLVSDTIRVREKENIVRPDMIQLMMEARKSTPKGDPSDGVEEDTKGKPLLDLADEDIAAQAFLFFLAGFDTSSTLLSFMAHSLAVNPDIQERLQQEIDEVLAEDGGRVTYESVQKMKYLDNVISETLRLWPPVTDLDRVCVKDYNVPATDSAPAIIFKKDDGISLPIFAMHHDPEHFPDPERFDPDRFNDENKNSIKPFTYFPFGSGPRACIGLRFAQMETKIAMVCILSRFNIQVTAKTPTPIVLEKGTFNTAAKGGMWLGIKPRN